MHTSSQVVFVLAIFIKVWKTPYETKVEDQAVYTFFNFVSSMAVLPIPEG